MQSFSTSSASGPCNSLGTVSLAGNAQFQQQLAGLMQQLTGLQQHTSQQHTLIPASQSIVAALQAASMLAQAGEDAMPAQHRSVQDPAPMARTTTNAGAMLRTLSSTNPRVLALAAAAAKAPAGTPEHAAVLSALKDEIMSATNGRTPAAAAATAAADCDEEMQPACCDPRTLATVNPAPAAETNPQLYQQPALTQDALWAALMAKAAARSGLGGSGPNSPHKQQQHQESPKPLPGHGSADSALEAEGTSCSLPWALLQAAQQAQQEEEEKEAALAAAAAASAAGAAAMEATAAAASPSVAAAAAAVGEDSSGSPRSSAAARPTSSASTRATNQVVFKRRSTHNSNALQKHFSRPAPLPSGPGLSRTQSEIPGVPKPQHTFKKQTRKKPLTLRVNSCSNLAALMQPGKQQPQQQQGCAETPLKPAAAAAAAATEPECSADTGGTAAAGSLLTHTRLEGSAPSLSGVSLRAPAVTAPAAIGAGGAVTDVLSFLANRGQQLQALQEQLRLHRRRISTHANASEAPDGDAATAAAAAAAAAAATSAGPGSPTFSNSMSPALTDLQRMLSSMAATAGARLPVPAAPYTADVEMMDACEPPMDSALEQAKRMLAAQREAAAGADAQVQAVSALKAMVAALTPTQQQQLLQQAIARAASANAPVPAPAASTSNNADLLRKLAAALHAMQ